MQGKGKQTIRRSLAEQLSVTFDDSLADLASSMDEMAAAAGQPPAPTVEPLDGLLDDFERAIDSVLEAREKTLASR